MYDTGKDFIRVEEAVYVYQQDFVEEHPWL
jgi:hypothetical protein